MLTHALRTHKAQVEQDFITGRKLINQYEIIDEIGRGVHGKVKLARSLETGDFVAIKIIQRFSKKRRLGRVTVSPEDKTKREIAILKKIRHPNIVGLLEVIDDPELKKIYMVLEHVELGEIVWRKKGVPQICLYERKRIDREQRGETDTGDDEKFFRMIERRRQRRAAQRAKASELHLSQGGPDYWSLEHGESEDDNEWLPLSRQATRESAQYQAQLRHSTTRSNAGSQAGSQAGSRATSRAPSMSTSRAHTPLPEHDIPAVDSDNEVDTPGPLPSISSNHGSASALEGTYYGPYSDDASHRGRSPSMADSIISHMSSVDDAQNEAFEEDYSYVPCFTMDQARSAFRDTVLGLEYLHYEGIVHRDIKPGNLLWTKDHRVKISDFGVSYFGRPIREGEPEETVSEGDATDFDDNLELAKTVGTPAFFAPELCYTDLDTEQPKVTEQIDVWSLGITLYCIIFARLPFLADDEYQLFRCIAKNDAYIPRRRLKAVNPAVNPSTPITNQVTRMGPSTGPCREDGELAYEDIDDELYDLIRRMLIKDPSERMKLREVKRHPWVLRGIDNVMGWLDDTDPSRKTAGRRIQVDRAELDHAVIPISIIERARSAVKKAVGKVLSVTRSETRSEGSRRRAASNTIGSGVDTSHQPWSPASPLGRDGRLGSLRGDESSLFAAANALHERREPTEHPLAQSSTADQDISADDGKTFSLDSVQQSPSVGASPKRVRSGTTGDFDTRSGRPNRSVSTTRSAQTAVPRGHAYSRSVTGTPISIVTTGHTSTVSPFTAGPLAEGHSGVLNKVHIWDNKGRDFTPVTEERPSTRARSVDRGIFGMEDKHGHASIATCPAVAPGQFDPLNISDSSRPEKHSKSNVADASYDKPLPSPLFFQPHMVHQHQTGHSSSPNVASPAEVTSDRERPTVVTRTPEGKTPIARVFRASTPQSFERAQEALERRKEIEAREESKRRELISSVPPKDASLSESHLPDDDSHAGKQKANRAPSSSSVNSNGFVTSSEIASPVSSVTLGSHGQIFASVPSLPALVSSSSSICADPEGDFLQQPGVVSQPAGVLSPDSTPETLTPSLHSKHASNDTETPTVPEKSVTLDVDEEGYNGDGDTAFTVGDDDSDSDEGLTMTRKKPYVSPKPSIARRGTSESAGSAETATKVVIDS
jgi:[calcium/calmodulin-dependent protein kinase] kinase